MKRDRQRSKSDLPQDMSEKVVRIGRTSKVVAGGRRFGFSSMIVVGDGKGRVGAAIGKAKEVPESIRKGREQAMRDMTKMQIFNNTIPHSVIGRCGATRVVMLPAVPGTGIIAGKSVRAVVESVGIRDILAKTIGSSNAVNVVYATLDGLRRLRTPESIAAKRGKTVQEIFSSQLRRHAAKRLKRNGTDGGRGRRDESEDAMDAGEPA